MDEKLKQEIANLSDLIGSRRLGLNKRMPPAQVAVTTRHNPGKRSPTRRLSTSRTSSTIRQTVIPNRKIPYPNPFRYISTGYARQVFPDVRDRNASLSIIKTGGFRYSYSPLYSSRIVNQGSSLSLNTSSSIFGNNPASTETHASTCSNGSVQTETSTVVRSQGLNVHADKLDRVLPSKSVIVNGKAHVNPAHSTYQLIQDQLKNKKKVSSKSTGSSNAQALNNSVDDGRSRSKQNSLSKLKSSSSPPKPGSSTTVRTQYKLDRREKRSPVRKRIQNSTKVASRLTKSFKQYSMRLVPTPGSGQNTLQFNDTKNSVAHAYLSSKKVRAPVILTKSPNFQSSKGKSKIVVDSDGNKFLRKSDGKALKRVKSKSSIVNISGNDFIRKNGGKSLKRLKSVGTFRKRTTSFSQSPHLGLRLAQRAVVKSKLALSQRTWKKKQLCVFYNRFGICKRSESNSCPYMHDRKHVLICPKFVVGKCTSTECKLSHDLKIGRMPPCQFYNKSECSRQNCPYPHVKSSPIRKSPKPVCVIDDKKLINPIICNCSVERKGYHCSDRRSPPKKGNISNRSSPFSKKKKASSPIIIKQEVLVEKESMVKSRYYEQAPVDTPEVSIIPRRLPRGVLSFPTMPVENDSDSVSSSVSVGSTSSSVGVSENLQDKGSSVSDSSETCPPSSRRVRLLNKVSRLVQRVKRKQQASLAPEYLSLKK